MPLKASSNIFAVTRHHFLGRGFLKPRERAKIRGVIKQHSRYRYNEGKGVSLTEKDSPQLLVPVLLNPGLAFEEALLP